MEIVVPKIEDFKRVNELAREVHELHVKWRPDLFVSVENVILEDRFKSLIENKNIYVIKDNEVIVGYAITCIKEKENHGMRKRKQFDIEAIGIGEEYRRKGYGTELLNYLKDLAKELECTDMYLTVNEENIPAIKIYEKFGFKLKNIAYSMEL